MRGYESYNFPAFDAATENLRSLGWGVFSPAERDREDGFNPVSDEAKPLSQYMAIDLPEVCNADAVICLPGWKPSEGVNIEVFVALSLRKPVLEYPDLLPIKPYVPFVAFQVCQQVMAEGLKKHREDSWLGEDANNHAMKSARHALTHMMIKDGHTKPDGEDHRRMCLCRAAMLVAQGLEDDYEMVCGV
jgi:hypothetical protein